MTGLCPKRCPKLCGDCQISQVVSQSADGPVVPGEGHLPMSANHPANQGLWLQKSIGICASVLCMLCQPHDADAANSGWTPRSTAVPMPTYTKPKTAQTGSFQTIYQAPIAPKTKYQASTTTAYSSTAFRAPMPGYSTQDSLARFIQSYNRQLSWPFVSAVANLILQSSKELHVDYRLITAIVAVESSFRHDAVSSSGAIGLGQLKPATAAWLGVGDPYNPSQNIQGTARYLQYLIRKFNGQLDPAIASYFQGPGSVSREGIANHSVQYLYRVQAVINQYEGHKQRYIATTANADRNG